MGGREGEKPILRTKCYGNILLTELPASTSACSRMFIAGQPA